MGVGLSCSSTCHHGNKPPAYFSSCLPLNNRLSTRPGVPSPLWDGQRRAAPCPPAEAQLPLPVRWLLCRPTAWLGFPPSQACRPRVGDPAWSSWPPLPLPGATCPESLHFPQFRK